MRVSATAKLHRVLRQSHQRGQLALERLLPFNSHKSLPVDAMYEELTSLVCNRPLASFFMESRCVAVPFFFWWFVSGSAFITQQQHQEKEHPSSCWCERERGLVT